MAEKLYYCVYIGKEMFCSDEDITILELSDRPDGLEDSNYEEFEEKFKKDFPEYELCEEMESIWDINYSDSEDPVDIDELREKLEAHPDYEPGTWRD
jgi:hypothetical protein